VRETIGTVGGRARILLVDDRPENLVALEAILSALSRVDLVMARSGRQALDELAAGEYAVVLLDVMMPGMDGFDTAARIRGGSSNKDVPIIFLTAAGDRPDLTFRGYTEGAVDYLAKPFDPWVLIAKVTVLVELYRKHREHTERVAGLIAAVEEAAALLARLPSVAKDPEAEDPLAQLLRRIGQLRDFLRDG
jgi:DNA-binding response OmpR family regulator